MAIYKDPLAPSSKSSISRDPLKPDAEDEHEVSQLEAALNGIASGVLKIPEGFVSLGAEIMDATGMTTNAAAKVEQVFDKINPFEEIAEQRAAGKILEALVSIGVPAGAGAKIASKLATKALQARKAGTYVNLKGKNVRKGMEKVYKLNDKARVQRFGAAVLGGAAGETLVADVENIGTIGDALEFGPTRLEVDAEVDYEGALPEDSQKDAVRKLFNRAKFGADSILYFPFIYGGAKAVGKVMSPAGKALALSSSRINKSINTLASAVRPTSDKPTAMFLGKMRETSGKAADTNFAIEQVKRIDKEVSKMFPSVKSFFNGSKELNAAKKEAFFKDLKELMFEGNLQNKVGNSAIYKKIKKQMVDAGLNDKSQNTILDAVYNSRKKFANLLERIQEGSTAKATLPKEMQNTAGLMGDRMKLMLGSTYKIFQNPVVDNLSSYKPAKESIDKVKEILRRHALRNGRELTEDQLDYRINEILTNVTKFTKGTQLPSFKMTDITLGAKTPDVRRNFQRILTKETGKGKTKQVTTQVIGPGSKAFRELMGEVDDARQSIFNGVGLLSTIARRSELIDDLLKTNDDAIKNKTTQLFYSDKNEAIKQLGAGGLNTIVSLDEYLKPLFKDGVLLNRLKGMFTTKETAEAFDPVNRLSDWFVGEKTGFKKGMSTAYKNLFLAPKAGAQVAKTVLSPTTHMRNFLSATGFSLANGTLFTNPKLFAEAAAAAARTVQLGLRSPKAMEEYREMLELGVVNSNVKMGDYMSLLKDIGAARDGSNFATSMWNNMLRKMARITEPAQQLYTLEDDVFKIFNFKVESARLAKAYENAGIKKTAREIKEEAADIVRNTVPNYAYVSDIVKGLRATPWSNFASFPSAIMNSGVGIGKRIFKEMPHSKPTRGSNMLPLVYETGKGFVKNDNPLWGIGFKRLLGSATAFGTLGMGIGAGYKAIFGTTDKQEAALERWVAPYEVGDKKFIIKDVDDEGNTVYYYQNWSNNNAYDYLEAPFRTLLRSVQEGIEGEEVLMKGFVKGISDAFEDFREPFTSESIAPEAIIDLIVRGGVTDTGRKLWTDQTPWYDQVKIASEHVLKTQIPFSQSQMLRIWNASQETPDKRGNLYELEKELQGLYGWRQVKIDPVKSLGFKITNYATEKRNATREFTGGDSRLLAGGIHSPEEIARQFFIANRSLFESQKNMHLDLEAAKEFEVTEDQLAEVFVDRGIPGGTYGAFFEGDFRPYMPSTNILNKFFDIDEKNNTNSMEQALPIIDKMIEAFQNMSLDEPFKFKMSDFGIKDIEEGAEEKQPIDPLQSNLQTPGVNPALMSQVLPSSNVMETGLTPTEQALLSNEEKGIRLRQRGMTT